MDSITCSAGGICGQGGVFCTSSWYLILASLLVIFSMFQSTSVFCGTVWQVLSLLHPHILWENEPTHPWNQVNIFHRCSLLALLPQGMIC